MKEQLLCPSCDLIRNLPERNGRLHVERKAVHVDSIRLLIVNLNAIKRTELLTEYNTGDGDVQYLRIGQYGSGKC